jgi:hypothetical protein
VCNCKNVSEAAMVDQEAMQHSPHPWRCNPHRLLIVQFEIGDADPQTRRPVTVG